MTGRKKDQPQKSKHKNAGIKYMKTVLFVLLDEFADWEGAFLASALRGGVMPGRPGRYEPHYATPGGRPVRSIGGMAVRPDSDLSALPEACAGVVLVGGMGWTNPEAEEVVPLVEEALRRGLVVGAICNAASFLAAHGFLNTVHHTGNTLEQLRLWGGINYSGETLYEERQAVHDGNLITANGSGYLEFTREYLSALNADIPDAIAASYAFNKQGLYRE